MTIELNRSKSTLKYRTNPYNDVEIDFRTTSKGARWKFLKRMATAEEARAEVFRLERDAKEDGE